MLTVRSMKGVKVVNTNLHYVSLKCVCDCVCFLGPEPTLLVITLNYLIN